MRIARNLVHSHSLARRLLLVPCLVVVLSLVFAPGLLAAETDPPPTEQCDGCHPQETEAWQNSPHARAASDGLPQATCESCHGSYVRGHPEDGTMQLTVDSSVCQDCHTGTFGQWEDSVHAQAGVQCIGCHLSHSQTLRLSDQTLCTSCHRDSLSDSFHTAHWYSDVTCTNCHLAPTTSPDITTSTTTGEVHVVIPAPRHDFVTVSAQNCLNCHSQEVSGTASSTSATPDASQMTRIKLIAAADRVPELTAQVETAKKENRSLMTTSVISLGLGLGIGGVMGIIFVLAVGYVNQRRSSK